MSGNPARKPRRMRRGSGFGIRGSQRKMTNPMRLSANAKPRIPETRPALWGFGWISGSRERKRLMSTELSGGGGRWADRRDDRH